jgi:hypothetical protein
MLVSPKRRLRIDRRGGCRQGGAHRARATLLVLVLPLAFLAMAFVASPAHAGSREGPNATVTSTCTPVTTSHRNFPNEGSNTVSERITVYARVLERTFSFNGLSGTDEIALTAPPARGKVDVGAHWHANEFSGDFDIATQLTCEAQPGFSIEKLQEIAGSGGGFTTSPLIGEAGQTVDYEVVVTNTGGTQLKFSNFTDEHCDEGTISGGPGESQVAPGESTIYLCDHLLTEVDRSADFYSNNATDIGTPPHGHGSPITHTSNTALARFPWVVSVGDSFISGEAGRWARNTSTKEPVKVDALGPEAYYGEPNKEPGEEAVPFCHRSKSAEIHIGRGVGSKNLACSGATTSTKLEEAKLKPGLDFEDKRFGEELAEGGRCPRPVCEGQALLLERFAREHRVRMVAVSIGGNDFHFGDIVQACVLDFLTSTKTIEERANAVAHVIEALGKTFENESTFTIIGKIGPRFGAIAKVIASKIRDAGKLFGPKFCSKEAKVTRNFTEQVKAREDAITRGIANVAAAMTKAGYAQNDYTILVQNYPSLIPEGASPVEGFRYPQEGLTRQSIGGCGFWNEDASWAVKTALPTLNRAVFSAAEATGLKNIEKMSLVEAFNGHILCGTGVGLIEEKGLPSWNVEEGKRAVNETEWINQIRITPAVLEKVERFAQEAVKKAEVVEEWAAKREFTIRAFNRSYKVGFGSPIRQVARVVRGLATAVTGVVEREKARAGGILAQEGLHPNYWGELALRNCVRQAYNKGNPKGGNVKCKIAGPGLDEAPPAPREPRMSLE